MRFVATLLFWLVATAALAVAVPTAWAQHNLVDSAGYAELAGRAATDPRLQQAMASELSTQIAALASRNGLGDVNSALIRVAASSYTNSAAFPGHFGQANDSAHRWLFTDSARSDDSGRWQIDLAPMLADTALQQTLDDYGIRPPATLTVPLTENAPGALAPGRLQPLAQWGPWVSVGATVVAGVFALLTLASARRRGKAFCALGVSALLVGAAGWAALEVLRRYLEQALNGTSGDVRTIVDVVVITAQDSAHTWLSWTIASGGILLVLGVIGSLLGGMTRSRTTRRTGSIQA
ncbi:MAG: hypothetical protein ACSLE6_14480 [Mycobacterium sp.]